jgi:AraC-like DNA-binding protein
MVSERCKISVKDILQKMAIVHNTVELGEIDLILPLSPGQIQELKKNLLNAGFELLEDKRNAIVERIITTIIQMVHYEEHPQTNYSDYLSSKLHYDYTYLAGIFSSEKGTTIERFIIMHKIEKVKELLEYGEFSLTEIAFKLQYSSLAHLSNQFKKVTGVTASDYKRNKNTARNNPEDS